MSANTIQTNAGEQWRAVPGFEGMYSVSDLGRVLSMERTCEFYRGTRRVRERLLKISKVVRRGKICGSFVKLCSGKGDNEYSTVARLVLLAFVGPPADGQVAHHKDGNCLNAELSNVEWSTFSNIAIKAGYTPPRKQEKCNL